MGIFSRHKKDGEKEKPPPSKPMVVQIFPIELWGDDNMLDGLLDGLQEASGRIMTSSVVGKAAGAFFVVLCLASGICLLVTGMYLADPEGFDKRLSQVLVERPVVVSAQETAEEKGKGEAEEEAVSEETAGE